MLRPIQIPFAALTSFWLIKTAVHVSCQDIQQGQGPQLDPPLQQVPGLYTPMGNDYMPSPTSEPNIVSVDSASNKIKAEAISTIPNATSTLPPAPTSVATKSSALTYQSMQNMSNAASPAVVQGPLTVVNSINSSFLTSNQTNSQTTLTPTPVSNDSLASNVTIVQTTLPPQSVTVACPVPPCPETQANTTQADAQLFWDQASVNVPPHGLQCQADQSPPSTTRMTFFIRLDVLAAMTVDSSSVPACQGQSRPGCGAAHSYIFTRFTCPRKMGGDHHVFGTAPLQDAINRADIQGLNLTQVVQQGRGDHLVNVDVLVPQCDRIVSAMEVGFGRDAALTQFASSGRMSIASSCHSWSDNLQFIIGNVAPCVGCSQTTGTAPDCRGCGPTAGAYTAPSTLSAIGSNIKLIGSKIYYVMNPSWMAWWNLTKCSSLVCPEYVYQ